MAAFERRIGNPSRLGKHVYPETWWGREEVMPTYLDNNTEALWKGWLLRAETDPGTIVLAASLA